jgi:hypothetical protein
MAIYKTAKNFCSTIKGDYTCTAKEIEKTSEEVEILAIKGNIELISNRKIIIKDKKV